MKRPAQTVAMIVDGVTYRFDAVVQSEHTHTMEIAEDAKDVKGKTHVNYAVRKPSKLVLEVVIADTVVVNNEPLTKGGNVRSEIAFSRLYDIQQKRQLITVKTRLFTYTGMLIETLSATENPDYQNEMHAMITLVEMTVKPKPKKKPKPPPNDDKGDKEDPSAFVRGGMRDSGKRGSQVALIKSTNRKDSINKGIKRALGPRVVFRAE